MIFATQQVAEHGALWRRLDRFLADIGSSWYA
jgi:hypothetical protein